MIEAPRSEKSRADTRQGTFREWVKDLADRALSRTNSTVRPGRSGNREKELFALRAQHVKALFRTLETTREATSERPALALHSLQPLVTVAWAGRIGDPAVFVSVAALHQGPSGGGPVAAVVDVGPR